MLIFVVVTVVVSVFTILLQLKRELMMLQQNTYRNDRYSHWIKQNGESTTYDRLLGWLVWFVVLWASHNVEICMSLMIVFGLGNIYRLLKAKYKKPLVWTARAKRIYVVSLVVVAVVYACAYSFFDVSGLTQALYFIPIVLLLMYCGSEAVIMVANWLLRPVESEINRKFYNRAESRLASMPGLKVIGVTGSYGKTSTKHYLHRILSEKYDVLMTPGNFNTTLGVVRTINEYLQPYNEVFIVEMGAKQTGDISEICELVHPTMGVITAVGPQHLESFGTIENVQATKFELADSLPKNGMIVLNNDFDMIANRTVTNTRCMRYTVNDGDGAHYKAEGVTYGPTGTSFTIQGPDHWHIDLHTRLVGECNVSNLVAAVVIARQLGVSDDKIKYAVAQIEQVEHRLSIKRTAAGITIIDDAYNSNPVGSKMALDVLSGMTGGKRIIITPGMIELGSDQYELNKKFGMHIVECADVAIVVGKYNHDAITEGLRLGGMPDECLHSVDTFAEAHRLMLSIATSGDTVLYENDLPDTFK